MIRPPTSWLQDLADLLHRRPDLAGIGLAAAVQVIHE